MVAFEVVATIGMRCCPPKPTESMVLSSTSIPATALFQNGTPKELFTFVSLVSIIFGGRLARSSPYARTASPSTSAHENSTKYLLANFASTFAEVAS